MLLVLPTAVVGYDNFAKLVNQAFARPFQKQESTFIVQTESSANISKGSEFSLKLTVTAPKSLPLKHFAAFIESDSAKIDLTAVRTQNNQLVITKFQNGYLIYPKSISVAPSNFLSLYPATCARENTCDFTAFSATSLVFSINGILLTELTEQQRPIKVSLLGASETETIAFWNEKTILPALKLGQYVKNAAPQFTSTPPKFVTEGESFTYTATVTDTDADPVILTLTCPDATYCQTEQKAPPAIIIENNQIYWENPTASPDPYEITLYANDGKSVSTQTFALKVLKKTETYFACTFTPAITVRILDYRVSTPLVVVAESSVDLASATVTLEKSGNIEQTFNYTFEPPRRYVILDRTSKPSLSYQFNEGSYVGKAAFASTSGELLTCELENPTVSLSSLVRQAARNTLNTLIQTVQAATGLDVGTNTTPVFTSDPMAPPASGGSSPGVSFVYNTPYSFTLKAKDDDGDPLQHTIVAKPAWAAASVTSSAPANGPSTYSIQFVGTPTAKDAGSNLFSVSINDGYGHYITRTWVINIDYPNNDIPKVTILEPTVSLSRYQGSPFLLRWEVEDRHQVVSFGVYYTASLGSSTKTTYNKNISYNTRGITVNTSSMAPGDYYFIVTATDGFSPPAIGSGYTAMVRILPPKPKPTATPKPTVTTTPTLTATPKLTPTEEPPPIVDELLIQITSPKNQVSIKAEEFQAVVSITASSKGTVSVANTSIMLDAEDITSKFTFSTEQGKALTASYKPSTLLEPGVHELTVKAKDSVQKEKEVKVSFIINTDGIVDPNTVNLFGINMSKSAYTIFIAALILIAILLLLPIILYLAFRNSDKSKGEMRRPVSPIQPTLPPTLKTPNTTLPNTSQEPKRVEPAFTPTQKTVAQGVTEYATTDIPRISPAEALASFVAQAPMQQPAHTDHTTSTNQPPAEPILLRHSEPEQSSTVKTHVTQQPDLLPKSDRPVAQFQTVAPTRRLAHSPSQPATAVANDNQSTVVVPVAAPPTIPSKHNESKSISSTPISTGPVMLPTTRLAPTLRSDSQPTSVPTNSPLTPVKSPTTNKSIPPESPPLPKL